MMTARSALLALAGLGLTLSAVTACGAEEETSKPPKTVTVNKDIHAPIDGTELLRWGMENEPDYEVDVTPCLAQGGIVAEGDPVVIRDASGTTIAQGALGSGTLGPGDAPISSPCVFTVSIDDVPLESKFYEIQVGTADPIPMEQAELTDGSQIVDVTS